MVAALVHAVENISDILFHAFRCNAMGGVIGDLSLAAALGLVNGVGQAVGHAVGVEQHAPFDIAGRPADGLNQ